MSKIKNALIKFMYGRYGVDKLYIAGIVLFIIVGVIRLFVINKIVSLILSFLMTAIFIGMFYRVFSKKIYKRRREEAVFLSIMSKITNPFKVGMRRFKERKTHVYIKCEKCKAQLRLPRKQGTLAVKCPKCSNEFRVKIK